jgi:hypothetical protein
MSGLRLLGGLALDDLRVGDLGEDDVFHQVYVNVALDRFAEY